MPNLVLPVDNREWLEHRRLQFHQRLQQKIHFVVGDLAGYNPPHLQVTHGPT